MWCAPGVWGVFHRVLSQATKMLSRGAFIHWYHAVGKGITGQLGVVHGLPRVNILLFSPRIESRILEYRNPCLTRV